MRQLTPVVFYRNVKTNLHLRGDKVYYITFAVRCIICCGLAILSLKSSIVLGQDSSRLRFAIHTIRADDTALRLVREAGFSWVVQLLEWREVEPAPGRKVWEYPDVLVQGCEYYGLNLALRLDHPPNWAVQPAGDEQVPVDVTAYARFVREVAERYRHRVQAYIIWNEPNLSEEWLGQRPDPAAYTALLKAAYHAVKAADSEAIVVSAGLAPTNELSDQAVDDRVYLQNMYEVAARHYFDVLGAHPYGFAYSPDDLSEAHEGLNFARLSQIRDIMIRNGDKTKPVWATEMGWTVSTVPESKAWQRVTPEQQAAFLVRSFEIAMERWPWLQLMAVWNLDAKSGQAHIAGYRIVDDEYRPLPAYRALAAMNKPVQAFRQTRSGVQGAVQVIAADVVVHLGDSPTVNPGWSPLYCDTAPCRAWRGHFYVLATSNLPNMISSLKMEIMQVEEQGNLVRINGKALIPQAIPLRSRPDFVTSWTTASMRIPPGVLRVGYNEIGLRASPRLVPYQGEVRFESFQVRNIRIVSAD